MKLCFLIDDKMHWALIDVLWYFFCTLDYSFFRGCFLVACYYCFQSYMQFVPQGNAWLWLSLCFFLRPKNLDFLCFAVCVPCFNCLRLWWNCASWIDDSMHWALIDVLWYSFCIQDYWVFRGCYQLASYFCFQKAICNFVPQGNAWLWLNLCFSET